MFRKPGILILTGPSGSGKTSTLKVIANDLSIGIIEWKNPIHIKSKKNTQEFYPPEDYSSTLKSFSDFLNSAQKFNPLHIDTISNNSISSTLISNPTRLKKYLILVEDFPNLSGSQSYQLSQQFHSLLRKYCLSSRAVHPIVFILCDIHLDREEWSRDQAMDIRHFLPNDLLRSEFCFKISFNPIAPTFMKKSLKRIIALHSKLSESPNNSDDCWIEGVVNASDGDLRSAVNTLEFIINTSNSDSSSQGRKRGRNSKHQSSMNHKFGILTHLGRSPGFTLFHALGKALYNKRETQQNAKITESLPIHLQHLQRNPFKTHPQLILDSIHVDPYSFSLFLHQNYPLFLSDVNEYQSISEIISFLDPLRASLKKYSLQSLDSYLTCASIMFYHDSISSSARISMSKPFYWEADKQRRRRWDLLEQNKSENLVHRLKPCSEYLLEEVAFTALINKTKSWSSTELPQSVYHRRQNTFWDVYSELALFSGDSKPSKFQHRHESIHNSCESMVLCDLRHNYSDALELEQRYNSSRSSVVPSHSNTQLFNEDTIEEFSD